MKKHAHNFVETYSGTVAFGWNPETDRNTIVYYLQKFSDDSLMETLVKRLSEAELEKIFSLLSELMKKHLTKSEYHQLFLKEHSE